MHCYNRGCGQTFDPENNHEDSCRHHPGLPYFHDAYKGWSCCNKKSVDFTEFLNIKGCTLSKHSNVKPPEAEKSEPTKPEDVEEVIEVRVPIKASMDRPAIETPMVAVKAVVAPALKEAIDTLKAKVPAVEPAKDESVVSVGTICKNSGCTYTFTGTSSDLGECQYHHGVPIFHEGMKYWSCCQKKTCDFTQFMAQKGCSYGQHKWFKDQDDKKVVQCRYDWHQTAKDVIVSIYAKLYHYERSTIELNPIRLHVNLVFPDQDNASYDLDMELRGVVDVKKTTAQMYASKVEITMPKAEPGHWTKLDFPRANLPAPKKAAVAPSRRRESDSDEGFDLDDIETVNNSVRLVDISAQKQQDFD